ncbi:dTDP-glucose 4,6-dehydratase [Tepiditoga spiralis]|uniref:dTDP-glucose 4,6-dehydratase n=1 Tax=Tepiditoga spiralis TaxID=2108365 RepID=A0A7G1G6Y2_9BACT|nr:NAD(P)-dependent oxidoreductase [Tepiditoga spiralis]BBE30623.1 dTDP-glucose 4,6-dehydratase [Tepiditoga spiralis]
MYKNPLSEDLDFIIKKLEKDIYKLKNENIFITGGTGFFGKWFLETLLYANEKLDLNIHIGILSRNPERFKKLYPHLNDEKFITFYKGDIRDFKFPEEKFSYIIHGASASAEGWFRGDSQISRFNIITDGTKRILDFAKNSKIKKFLYMSSGKVYGTHPIFYDKIPENYCGNLCLDDPNAALSIGKKSAEFLTLQYSKEYNFNVAIARGFAFVGPYLQLNLHYAIGNFIRDAINNKSIIIKGDGTPIRSYLYAADAIIWFLKILLNSKNMRIYNVGSEKDYTIKEIAEIVSKSVSPKVDIIIKKSKIDDNVDKYIPSVEKIKSELNVDEYTDIYTLIMKTIRFYKERG